MILGPIGLGYALPGATLLQDDRGVSETFTGMIEAGSKRLHAHIKFLSTKGLINELIASVLGSATGLPMPKGFLVLAERRDFPTSQVLKANPSDIGFAFACATMDHPSLRRRMKLRSEALRLEVLKLWPQWAEAIAFDDWIANWDRHEGNLLSGGPGEVWLIDNERSFVKLDWTAADLNPAVQVLNQLCMQMQRAALDENDRRQRLQQVYTLIAKIKKIDPMDVITAAQADKSLSSDDVDALRQFLTERTSTIATRISAALGLPILALGINP
jgi:hypothetical protein